VEEGNTNPGGHTNWDDAVALREGETEAVLLMLEVPLGVPLGVELPDGVADGTPTKTTAVRFTGDDLPAAVTATVQL